MLKFLLNFEGSFFKYLKYFRYDFRLANLKFLSKHPVTDAASLLHLDTKNEKKFPLFKKGPNSIVRDDFLINTYFYAFFPYLFLFLCLFF